MAAYSDRSSLGILVHPHAIKGVDEWMSQIVASRAFDEEEAAWRRTVSGLEDRAISESWLRRSWCRQRQGSLERP